MGNKVKTESRHGSVDLHRAIIVSCDVYFYTLGKLLGIEKIDYFAKRLGLGARTGIDLPGEAPGLIPSPEWVQKAFKRKWWAGETMSVAIGQGAVVVTPLQLAHTIGAIASGGTFSRPHLAFKDQLLALGVDPPDDRERELSPEREYAGCVNARHVGRRQRRRGDGRQRPLPGN